MLEQVANHVDNGRADVDVGVAAVSAAIFAPVVHVEQT